MTTPPEPHQVLRRYLTPFYGFTLGLALALAIIASTRPSIVQPVTAIVTQDALVRTVAPTQGSTQIQSSSTESTLPAIPPTPNESTPSPLGVTAAELNGLTVTLWHPWTGQAGAALQAMVDEFNRTNHWGLTVLEKGYDGFGRLDEAVDIALNSNALTGGVDGLPDVLVDYGYKSRQWNKKNTLVDLIPYVDDPVWGFTSQQQNDFYPQFWAEDLVYDDRGSLIKRQGLPFYRSAYVIFYNQSWGRELGYLTPPTTPDEFRERACAAANAIASQGDRSLVGKGGWIITPQPGAWVGWIYAFGGHISTQNGVGYQLNTPEMTQALEYLKGLQESGCAWVEAGADAQGEFAKRHGLFIIGSLFDITAMQQAFNEADNADEWMVVPFPSNDGAVVSTYGPSLYLTHSTPERQLAAWLLVEWLVYPTNQAEWVSTLGVYPTRLSTLNYLTEASASSPQWAEALQLVPYARSEPNLASWSVMRWALSDAMVQLFDPQFKSDQTPSLLEDLNNVAAEIVSQVP